MSALPITIYDVARTARVSLATVSRVLNNNPNVKHQTRQKVLGVIEQLGFRPNAVARGLASKKTTTIGVVIPDISSAALPDIVRGIEDIALMYGYNIIVCNSDHHLEKELRLINTMLEKQVDGLLFMGEQMTSEHIDVLHNQVPVVLCGTSYYGGALPSVDIDHAQAAYDAVRMLIDYGHRDIAMIAGLISDPWTGAARVCGYERAMREARIAHERIVYGKCRYRDGMALTKQLLSDRPSAIFCATDEMALGAIHALQDSGLRVPDQVSVISIGNLPLAEMVRPMLTTVAQQMYDIGAVSMRLLTKLIEGEPIAEMNVTVPHHIVVRQSVCAK